MTKNYSVFVDELRTAIIRETGIPQERIYFEAKGSGRHTPNGDRLFIECAVSEGTKEICGIFTQELFRCFHDRCDVNELAVEVAREIESVRNAGYFENTKKLESYNKAKDQMVIRMLNLDEHYEELRDAIYRVVGDMALVLYMQLGESNGRITSVKIKKNHARLWKMNEDDVFEYGLHNMLKMTEPRIFLWDKLLEDLYYPGEAFLEKDFQMDFAQSAMGVCLSTADRINGAAMIFLPGIAQRLGELMGDDYYLVFTSVHEVMIHPVTYAEPSELKRVLKDTVDETTPEEDFLTYQIYRYDRGQDLFTCVSV